MNAVREVLSEKQIDFITRFLGVSISIDTPQDHAGAGDAKVLAKLRDTAGKRLTEVDAIRPTFGADAQTLSEIFQSVAACDDSADPQDMRAALIDATLRMRALSDRVADVQTLSEAMPVSFSVAALDWKQASDALIGQVRDIQAALAAEIEDPDTAEQVRKLDSLCKTIAGHGNTLADRMRAVVDSADAAARAKAAGPALASVAACIAFCEGSPLLAHISDHPLDGADGADAESHLLEPLKTLRTDLSSIS